MRISDWSSDVCSSDLRGAHVVAHRHRRGVPANGGDRRADRHGDAPGSWDPLRATRARPPRARAPPMRRARSMPFRTLPPRPTSRPRSEEHTSELQSLMRISYAVFCLKKKNNRTRTIKTRQRPTDKTYDTDTTH